MIMIMIVFMIVFMTMAVMIVLVIKMNIEFRSEDSAAVDAGDAQVVASDPELFKLTSQEVEIEPAVDQSADKHVAAYAGEAVEV